MALKVDNMAITFPRALLVVGILCLALAGWSFIQGESSEGLFGLGLGASILLYWRWMLHDRAQD
jgi:hypothetical protein